MIEFNPLGITQHTQIAVGFPASFATVSAGFQLYAHIKASEHAAALTDPISAEDKKLYPNQTDSAIRLQKQKRILSLVVNSPWNFRLFRVSVAALVGSINILLAIINLPSNSDFERKLTVFALGVFSLTSLYYLPGEKLFTHKHFLDISALSQKALPLQESPPISSSLTAIIFLGAAIATSLLFFSYQKKSKESVGGEKSENHATPFSSKGGAFHSS